MDHQAEMLIRNELDSGEKFIWAGRPKQGLLFRGSDIFMIPFSLLWGGFAIVWEIMALAIPNDEAGPVGLIFPIFGIPFVIVGMYMIFGRFVHDSKRRAKTFYGITDQRVIILSGLFSKKVKSLNIKTLTDISMNEKSDSSGSISFGQENPWAAGFGGGWFPGMGGSQSPKFEIINEVKLIYNKIRSIQKDS
jgi:hypothetical protein